MRGEGCGKEDSDSSRGHVTDNAACSLSHGPGHGSPGSMCKAWLTHRRHHLAEHTCRRCTVGTTWQDV